MRLSVIISTHNDAGSVARTVRSALALDYPADQYEVVVVDNASTDETPAVVYALQDAPRGSVIRYVHEARLGKHYACHAGTRAATGDVLLFTDDDVTLSPQWASAYAHAFYAHDEMAAAGGPIRPSWDAPPPRWLIDFIDRKDPYVGGPEAFGVFGLLDRSPDLLIEDRGFFYGANMAIRRGILYELGGFNPDAFGRTWLGDGETGLVFKLWSRGLLVGYVPDATVDHHIDREQMTVRYLRRRMANQGACDAYTEFHAKMPSRRGLARQVGRTAEQAVRRGVEAIQVWNRTDAASLLAQMKAAHEVRRLAYTVRLILDAKRREFVRRDDWLEREKPPPR